MSVQRQNDLSSFLKEENDLKVARRAGGKLFHARGPATAYARSPVDARRVGGRAVRRRRRRPNVGVAPAPFS